MPAADAPDWQALALRALGDEALAEACLTALTETAEVQAQAEVRIPYFATSLPTLLLFHDDLSQRARQEALYLEGLALLGQGQRRKARGRLTRLLESQPDHLGASLRLTGR